jgi:hypothetical protein
MARKRQTAVQVQRQQMTPLVFGTTIRQAQPSPQGMGIQRNQYPSLSPSLESPQKKQKKVQERFLGDPNKRVIDPNTGYSSPTTGLIAFELRTHSQMWRVTKHGGIGSRLGSTEFLENQIVIYIDLQLPVLMSYNEVLKKTPPFREITESELLAMVIKNVYDPLYSDLDQMIDKVVPRDSGRLRLAMKYSIGKGGGGSTSMTSSLSPFFVLINAGRLKYAGPVNQMPDEWLKHPGLHGRTMQTKLGRGQKVKRPLNDPDAETGWFEKVVTFGRQRAEQYWNTFITAILPNQPKILDLQTAYQRATNIRIDTQFITQSLFVVSFS